MDAALDQQQQSGSGYTVVPPSQSTSGGYTIEPPSTATATSTQDQFMAIPNPQGLKEPGNLPIQSRPVIINADGSRSTEYSISNRDPKTGYEVLVPTVVNGKFLTPDGKKPPEGSQAEKDMKARAWQHYRDTGENLGKFDGPDNATAYAHMLHTRQDTRTEPDKAPQWQNFPPGLVDSDKLTRSLINAKLFEIPAAVAYNNDELVSQQAQKRGSDLHDNVPSIANDIKVGTEGSIFGMSWRNKLPDTLKSPGMVDKFVQGTAQMVADLPFYIMGGIVGGTAGGIAGTEFPVIGNVVGAGAGGTTGAFVLPAIMRETLIQGIKKGDINSFSDLMDRSISVAYAGMKEIPTALAAEVSGGATIPLKALGPAAPVAETLLKKAQQGAAIELVSKLSEGKVPTADGFAVNTALMIAMHYTVGGVEKATDQVSKVHDRVMNAYVESNAHPAVIAAEALRQAQESPTEDVIDRINAITRPAAPTPQQEAPEAPQQPSEEPKETAVPEPAPATLRPASREEDGTVHAGGQGEVHDDVAKRVGNDDERGFVDTQGEFLTRKEAEVKLQETEPEVYQHLENKGTEEGLHSEDYNQARQKSTGIKNAAVDVQREQRGLPSLESSPSTKREDVYSQAQAKVDSGVIDPLHLAESVIRNPQAVSSEQTYALNYYNAQLSNQHATVMDAIEKARADDDPQAEQAARERLADIERKQDTVEKAVRITGTESGRALEARKAMIAEDYSLSRVLQRARIASKTGEISPEVRDQLETLTKQLEDANKKVDEYEAKQSERAGKDAIKSLQEKAARTERKAARQAKRTNLDEEFDTLIKEFDSLVGRMSANPFLDPELAGVVGKMALNRVKSGLTRFEDVVDYVHEKLTDIGHEFSKREIGDAISGYGKTAEMSQDAIKVALRDVKRQGRLLSALEDAQAEIMPLKSGLQRDKVSERVQELQKQVKQAVRESGLSVPRSASPEAALARYKQYLTNRIDEMERQLKTGDFSKETRKPLALDEEATKLKLNAERTRQKIDQAIDKQKREARSTGEKVVDNVTKWRRFGLLSGWSTLGKLTKAAMDRMGVTPIEELVGGVLSKLPGVSKISERASTQGGGFNPSAEVAAVSQLWQKATAQDMWNELKEGQDSLDTLFGGKAKLPPEVLGLFGQLHGALKVPEKRAEFFRRFEIGMEYARKNNLDVNDPRVQSAVGLNAYLESQRAILMQDNALTGAYQVMLGYLHSQGAIGKTIEAGLHIAFPMVRVATNLPGEALAYNPLALIPRSIQVIAKLADKDRMGKSAFDNLSMHDMDNIMRGLKKGSVGLALAAIGFSFRKNITGYYLSEADKKRGIKRGIMKIGGVTIPAILNDTPPLIAIQLAATVGHVWDHYNMKGLSGGLIAGAEQAGIELAKRVPFYGQTIRAGESTSTPERAMVTTGGFLGSLLIPRLVSEIAEATDKDKKRVAKTPTEAIKLQIPGLRKTVHHHLRAR